MATLQFLCIFHFALFAILNSAVAVTKEYYIGAVDVMWDYAPSDINQKTAVKLDDDEDASVFTKKSKDRIGKIYKKTIYREFTDGSFAQQKFHRQDLGILGPVIKGEVGDTIKITFKNMAKRGFTMHPHGVSYEKSTEGAIYEDYTKGKQKKDDKVQPGQTHVYKWKLNPENGPTRGDQACIPTVYHSHIMVANDINTGLIGLMLICKKGTFHEDGNTRVDVDKEMFLMQNVFDENKSWYLDENLKMNGINPSKINKEDEDFMESNLMHAVNGRFYGNLEGLDVCYGKKVAWYLGALGNEVDMHTAAFTGHMVEIDHHKTDVTSLFPATTASAMMKPKNLGRWLFSCKVADHLSGGMFAFYNVNKCKFNGKIERPKLTGKAREYFIAAVEEPWSYAPTNENKFDGGSLSYGESSGTFFDKSYNRIGGTYIKAMYVEYTDSSFTTRKARTADEKHLGFMGPVIKAEVGDVIRVVFQNKASRAYSIHPRGVWYDKYNEGYFYDDGTKSSQKYDDAVYPYSQFTYEWFVPEEMSPTDQDPPCVARLYESTVDPVKDMYSGLIGPLVICKKGSLKSNGNPIGYDAERYILMAVMDENKSWYLDANMAKYCLAANCFDVDKENEAFVESNKMHQINGRMYGQLKGLDFCQGDKILWHTLVVGTETDIHAIYFHGNSFEIDGNNKDSLTLFPGGSASFTMTSDNVGKWALECKVNDHYMAGMKAHYEVKVCGAKKSMAPKTGMTRKYYIGIVEVVWNYATSRKNVITGDILDVTDNSKVFTKRGPNRIGKSYKKVVYREFRDESFTRIKSRRQDEKHLGVLGPIIRAEEGDEIEVVLKNMASRKYSIHPHGLQYDKRNEGAVYVDGTRKPADSSVSPGKMRTYKWFVPKHSAPGPKDSACITWSYYSAVDVIKDTNSGLIGPLITCRKGTLNRKGKRVDIDKEFALLFTVLDENESWYLKDNIQKFALDPSSVSEEDEDFKESNKMHAINGFLFGNGPNNGDYLRMKTGDKVAWYLIGFGNEVDIHTVHFHANDFIHRTNSRHRDNTYNVFPGVFETVEMQPKHKGTWLLHCHVHDHLEGGMETRYTVYGDYKDSSCKDRFKFCANRKNSCYNNWTKRNCLKTCTNCDKNAMKAVQCVNQLNSCGTWKMLGFCNTDSTTYKYMLKWCAKTCNKECQ